MKFLCDNCKAKYQIGDDKVAGKTVRMKCRRCGHSITVSSKLTESSVSRPSPADPQQSDAAPDSGPEPIGTPAPQQHAAPPQQQQMDEESTQIMASPMMFRPQGAPAPGPRPAPVGAPRVAPIAPIAPIARPAPAPPRPLGAVSAPQANAPMRPVTALRGAAGSPARDLRQQPAPAPEPQQQQQPQPQHRAPQPAPSPHGVAAAFQRAVADPQATAASSRLPPHEDWYVGVGGVPLGPVRLDVIREKALLGQVNGDSLVWREGFDEWQPLKKFPELIELLEGAHSVRQPQSAPRTAAMNAYGEPSHAHQQAPGAPQRVSSGIALAAGLASPAGGARAPTPSGAPYGQVAQQQQQFGAYSAAAQAPSPGEAASVLADPFGKPATSGLEAVVPAPSAAAAAIDDAAARAAAAGPNSADLADLIPRQQRMNPMALAFIAMAAVFGGVAAYFVFFKPPPQAQIVVVEKTMGPGSVATGAPSTGPEAAAPSPTAEVTAAPTAKPGSGSLGPLRKPTATPGSTGSPVAPIDVGGPSNNLPGPSQVGPSSEAPPSGAGQLSQGEIQGVVSSHQASIRRSCWEPALQGRGSSGPTSAKVNAQIVIGPSGNVESSNATGADSFPGLAGCIAGKMKAWKFPPSGGSQPVNVPFVFAGQ